MRDPELVMRAQRAAMELERAWERWRTMHRLVPDPLPPVSSYVGYSMEEPWGQPRVVFGIDAREAEQFVALLDHHDCEGPVYSAMTAKSGTRAEPDADILVADPGRGRVRVPSQGPPASAQREEGAEPSPAKALFGPLEARAQRGAAEPGPTGQARPQELAEDEPLAPLPAQHPDTAASALPAFVPQHEPGPYAGDDPEAAPATDQPAEPAKAGQASGGWARRIPGGHTLPRQKRAGGAGKGAGAKQEGKDRAGLSDLAAELAGWAAGELPGEASHRRMTRPDRPLG
jgi:hypothetical protein